MFGILDLQPQPFAVLFGQVDLDPHVLNVHVKLVECDQEAVLVFLYEDQFLPCVGQDLDHRRCLFLELVEVLVPLLNFLI